MTQLNLFNARKWELLNIPQGDFKIMRNFLAPQEADALFEQLHQEVTWRQDQIHMYGKRHSIPRLHQWFGDAGMNYSWSGISMVAQRWLPCLTIIREQVQLETQSKFNAVLVNLYRDGNDTVNWHADDEHVLGRDPIIASVSLGATRDFMLRRRQGARPQTIKISLTNGSLLLMGAGSQVVWEHKLPRRKGLNMPRINLTFRWFVPRTAL